MQSFDVSTEVEELLTALAPSLAVKSSYTADVPVSFDFSSVNKTFTISDATHTTTIALTTNTTDRAGFMTAVNALLTAGSNDVRVTAGAAGKVVYGRQTSGVGAVTLAGTDQAYFKVNPVAVAGAAAVSIDLVSCNTLDMVGMVKPGALATSPFQIVKSIACPLLYPEKVSYKFTVQQNSTLDVSLRGDQINYCPGTALVESAVGTGSSGQTVVTVHPAGVYVNTAGTSRVLAVSIDGQRQVEGLDFTATPANSGDAFSTTTVALLSTVAATSKISVVYFTNATTTLDQSVHPSATAKPPAVKGRDIRVYIGATYDPENVAGSAAYRWTGVQSAAVDWAVNVVKDYELGNTNATTVEPEDVPTVNGSVTLRARNSTELFTRLRQITGVSSTDQAIGPDNAVELPMDIVVLDSLGTVHKRLHVPDARFSLPGYSAQIGQRVDLEMQFTSDSGTLKVFSA
jgi:hypothetical protein